MKYFTAFLTFTVSLSFCAIIAWLGGFNFDQRTPDVAFGFTISILFSTLFAFLVGDIQD